MLLEGMLDTMFNWPGAYCVFYDGVDQEIDFVYVISRLVIGLTGNITACIIILCSQSFHTLTGFYLLSLSTADILILIVGASYNSCLNRLFGYWMNGESTAYIGEWLFQTSSIVSTVTVTAFTIERYLAICHPFVVQSIPKKSRVKIIIIGIWTISGVLALLPVARMYIDVMAADNNLRVTNQYVMQYLIDVQVVLYFCAPMLAIVVMYVLIWCELKNRERINCRVHCGDKRTLMLFVGIIVIFFISWGPYNLCRVLDGRLTLEKFNNSMTPVQVRAYLRNMYLVELGKQLSYPISPILNPVIYSMMSKKFRQAFKDLLWKNQRSFVNWWSRLSWSRNETKIFVAHI